MKTALVLSGGGTKGSLQLGFCKYLFEQGLRPDVIYGTSTGALNACGLSFIGIQKTEEVWRSITKTSDIFKLNWPWPFSRPWMGLYNGDPLRQKVKDVVSGKWPVIPAYACQVSLRSGAIEYVLNDQSERYIDAVVASASVPVLTDPVNGEWVDGGVREQAPLKQAILDGVDKIVVVLCNPWQENPEESEVGSLVTNLLRTADILSHEVFRNDIENCLWYNDHAEQTGKRIIQLEVYAPSKLVIGTNDFDASKIKAALEYGYEEAKKGPVKL